MKPVAGSLRRRRFALAAVLCAATILTGCQSSSSTHDEFAPPDDAPIFSSKEYGVAASPRVTNLRKVRKGGGRAQVGKPYKVRGKWYYPKEDPSYVKSGKASWYGANFHGRLTANGEVYDMYHLSAAHPTFPLPSYARVTNHKNGRSVMVRVNDRGPYAHGRVLDVSAKAAEVLAFKHDGIGDVKVEYVGRAPLEGDDTRLLMASFRPGAGRVIDNGLPTGVMIAAREQPQAPVRIASAVAPSLRPNLAEIRPAGIGSVEDVIQSYDAAPADPMSAPIPTARSVVLSYAPAGPMTGAAEALATLSAGPPASERIEIGLVDDVGLLARIGDIAEGRGDLIAESNSDGVSLALQADAGEDVDAILQSFWTAGASGAFVIRD